MPASPGRAERVRCVARSQGGLLPRSRRRTRSCPTNAGICPGRSCSRRRGTRRPAGSPCTTSWSSGRRATNGAAGYRRPPGDETALGTLLRVATCSSGRVEVEMNCLPLFEYGTTEGEWTYDGSGYRLRDGAERRSLTRSSRAACSSDSSGPAVTAARRSRKESRRSSHCRGATTFRRAPPTRSTRCARRSGSGATG